MHYIALSVLFFSTWIQAAPEISRGELADVARRVADCSGTIKGLSTAPPPSFKLTSIPSSVIDVIRRDHPGDWDRVRRAFEQKDLYSSSETPQVWKERFASFRGFSDDHFDEGREAYLQAARASNDSMWNKHPRFWRTVDLLAKLGAGAAVVALIVSPEHFFENARLLLERYSLTALAIMTGSLVYDMLNPPPFLSTKAIPHRTSALRDPGDFSVEALQRKPIFTFEQTAVEGQVLMELSSAGFVGILYPQKIYFLSRLVIAYAEGDRVRIVTGVGLSTVK